MILNITVLARTNQQAPVCQRHSQVQAGREGLLQADQRTVNNHRHRIQGLPAGGVKGNVCFNYTFQSKRNAGNISSGWMTVCFTFRNMKMNSTKLQPSESSSSLYRDTSQRSVLLLTCAPSTPHWLTCVSEFCCVQRF